MNKKIKVNVDKFVRNAVINAFILGHIDEKELHMIIKKNNIKLLVGGISR